jgi:hypothetical protein
LLLFCVFLDTLNVGHYLALGSGYTIMSTIYISECCVANFVMSIVAVLISTTGDVTV